MVIWGKFIGGISGYLIGGPIGALIGVFLGHKLDSAIRDFGGGLPPGFSGMGHAQVQQVFFETTFTVMGHMAKADGRVSEAEISLARQVMAQMGLPEEVRLRAMQLFSEGKQVAFDLNAALKRFQHITQLGRNLRLMFLEIQLHAAYADGQLHAGEQRVLEQICQVLGFSAAQLKQLEAMVQAQRHAASGGKEAQVSLQDAYAILNISEQATDAEVKRAYRRLTNQHHPDKLVAKGLPEEMMKIAAEKTREIRAAYERIKEARGL
jgi:DnaJ like chaperone protein